MLTDEFLDRYRKGQKSFTNDIVVGGISLSGHTFTGLRLIQMQFSGVDLTDAVLDEVVCERVNFGSSSLMGASLQRAKLSEMVWQDHRLDRANLTDADLSHAQLQFCSFRDAVLVRTDCSSANLRGTQLQGADLREARLVRAVLEEVRTDERTQWPDDVAFLQGVQLSPRMTVAKLTGRKAAHRRTSHGVPAILVPIPGSKAVAIEKVQQAILHEWHTREEQPAFRRELLRWYQGRCAISGVEIVDGLDAAHIIPYKVASGQEKGAWTNGLPLRADLHRLFDLGRLWIDPETYLISLDENLQHSPSYQQYHHSRLLLPIWPESAREEEARLQKNLRWRQQHYRECLAGVLMQMIGEE